MEAATGAVAPPQEQQQQPAAGKTERLNTAVQQQLNLDSVKTRALSLFKAISRILEDFDAYARTSTTPKWQDALGQFSMVNMELFNIVEDIKKVSKAFVVYPKNVTVENATILPVMLSSKLLPEMEAEDNAKRDQLLSGMQNVPIPTQIEKIKARIDMIAAACEAAEKVIADARKAYGLGSRQGPTLVPTLDKVQAAKIQEQENQLRAAVNYGEGLRIPVDQRHLPSSLPSHLVDVLTFGDSTQSFGDNSGIYQKNTPTFSSNNVNAQGGVMQAAGAQLIGRSVPSPSGVTGNTNFDNVNASTPPMPYANSPRSGTNMMNTPSPQQQSQQQQQRQKMMQIPQHQQQLLAQQQLRQSTNPGVLGQNTISQLHDLQGQAQQKFQQVPGQHQMQFSQSLSQSQFQNRQMQAAHLQHNIAQNQLTQGNQLRNHLSQFTGSANSALFNAAQSQPNSQMLANMSATMQSQSLMPRVQFGLSGALPQRNHSSQMLNDQMFGVGGSNNASMVAMQQQQHGIQGGYGNMNLQANTQNLQAGMVGLPNASQNPNFPQQRQQNQQ
ncbi:mediator of RNA polymerase II transcription subunit 8 [Dioscorea cayenensis subsp. rotundata]|uniref:Mediator of RNA polymerase II transcription subunit 8 n=1 Tax=Dioscorea cayennensis subsp. rotundata TaxID=55577 RepID=A0AB40BYX2_DIOCR|nr:mediator of RNA polymerase II transcription subunit 8 [Dioscorea cayenensis subsp. rotundata]